ncbi:MAG: hypothetical protein JWR26_3991 [Pedosphaera sp.]|nr:hypothetical protein [Pedosphaera sp.]
MWVPFLMRMINRLRQLTNGLFGRFALRLDVGRAIRATVALMIPLVICHWLGRPADALFIGITAQNLSLPDFRGAYRFRLFILLVMTMVSACSALLGVACAGSVIWATLAMGAIALINGVWRHLSADYGPSLSVTSALLFLLGLAQPGGLPAGLHLAGLAGLGGLGAMLLHAVLWLVRPQHPLRYAVAETWVAASDLVASMRVSAAKPARGGSELFASRERELRASLDRTFLILSGAGSGKESPLTTHLEEMRREVVHFAMRVMALNTAMESVVERPEFKSSLPILDSVLKALGDAARSVAVTLIVHRHENLAASSVRLRRCEHLVRVLDEQIALLPAGDLNVAQLRAVLEQILQVLPRIRVALSETVDQRSARFHFPVTLPELGARPLRSLAGWVNPATHLDPVLVRHALRMALLTMVAVGMYKGFKIPRGYWIAFTIMVVLQPDYGSTRQRAGQRIGGTLAAVVIASALLWIQMPWYLLDAFIAITSFGFAYFLTRRYGLAIFFVTIMIVLLMETTALVHVDLTIARLLSTLLGGGLALLGARAFWPIWAREKFPALLAAAIRANKTYLQALSLSFSKSAAGTRDMIMMAKRRAENANRFVAASLERLLSEPVGRREKAERDAALTTYNQRVTRALSGIAIHLEDGGAIDDPAMSAVIGKMVDALEKLAQAVEVDYESSAIAKLAAELGTVEVDISKAAATAPQGAGMMTPRISLIRAQVAKTVAEMRVMTLAMSVPSSSAREGVPKMGRP